MPTVHDIRSKHPSEPAEGGRPEEEAPESTEMHPSEPAEGGRPEEEAPESTEDPEEPGQAPPPGGGEEND